MILLTTTKSPTIKSRYNHGIFIFRLISIHTFRNDFSSISRVFSYNHTTRTSYTNVNVFHLTSKGGESLQMVGRADRFKTKNTKRWPTPKNGVFWHF